MTFNGRTALYCTNDASFGAHRGNLKEDRPILLAEKYVGMDSNFRRYKVYAHTRGGSVARRLKRQSESALFGNSVAIFSGPLVEASITMQRHEMPYRLSSNPKTLDLE